MIRSHRPKNKNNPITNDERIISSSCCSHHRPNSSGSDHRSHCELKMEGNNVLGVMIDFVEQQLMRQEQELEQIAIILGQIGARIVGVMEDGVEIDEAEHVGRNWERVEVDLDGYRLMGDPSFRLHFRMRKPTYEMLLRAISQHLVDTGRVRRVRNPLDIPLLMVLWILANPDTFRSVALRFGVLPGVVHFHYQYIIEALREMAPKYIQWPNEERQGIKTRFRNYSGFPGIVGVIDGTYNVITAPIEQKERYRNRHHTFSLNTMVVCDDNLLIRDMYIGEAGSMHDQRVFRRSPLYGKLLSGDGDIILPDEHIICDGAFTLMEHVMVPFRNVGNLNEQQRRCNYRLSRCRARIEHAFGKAFGQWRRMKHLHSMNMELVVDHITACFVLHNFMIIEGEVLLDLGDPDNILGGVDEEVAEDENIDDLDERAEASKVIGAAKRLRLVDEIVDFNE